MKKIVIPLLLLLTFALLLSSCVSRGVANIETDPNLDAILDSMAEALSKEVGETELVAEIIYTDYDDHSEVTGCNAPIGDVVILSEHNGKKVTKIADYAFEGLVSITSVTLPGGLVSIGEKAFIGCSSLSYVIIPDTVESIGRYAFYGCSAVKTIAIGKNVREIATNAFGNCTALSELSVTAGNGHFASEGNVLFSADRKTLICYPAGLTATSYTIPASVSTVSNFAFAYASSLTDVSMTSVSSLGDYTFCSCTALKNINFGSSLTFIGACTFQDCTALTSVTIPEGVVSIGYVADSVECGGSFCDCTALTTVELPSTIKNIYLRSFDGCTALTKVNYAGTKAQWDAVKVGEENAPLTSIGVIYK